MKLFKAEIEARYTPEIEEFVKTTYAAQLEQVVCRECGAHQGPGGGECKSCGERDNLSKQDNNEAHQATRTLLHGELRRKFPELTSEGAWSLVDGTTADYGVRSDLGAVWRSGFKWDDLLHETKIRAHRERLANMEAGAAAGVTLGIIGAPAIATLIDTGPPMPPAKPLTEVLAEAHVASEAAKNEGGAK